MIILISGKKRVGKDFVGQKLQELLAEKGKSFKIVQYSTILKSMVKDMFNLTSSELDDLKNSNSEFFGGKTMRQFLQHFGTDVMQKYFGEKVFVNLLLQTIKDEDTIITDCRFKHEIISDYVIRVKGDESVTDTHISECALDDFEFKNIIQNYPRLPTLELEERLEEILKLWEF